MRDLDKALADIGLIRGQIAAGTAFLGYGPAAIAASGGFALLTILGQHVWLDDPNGHPTVFFATWIATACASAGLVWVEMRARSRRHHHGLADAMLHQAVEQFLPAVAAGIALALMLWRCAPEVLWMLPGLWQVLVALGVFASIRTLPRGVVLGGAWYFVAGFGSLLLASESHALSPWTMGMPFVIGQFLIAALLRFAPGVADDEE
jgi:hypothetical protein